jgi:hypothetical protein
LWELRSGINPGTEPNLKKAQGIVAIDIYGHKPHREEGDSFDDLKTLSLSFDCGETGLGPFSPVML